MLYETYMKHESAESSSWYTAAEHELFEETSLNNCVSQLFLLDVERSQTVNYRLCHCYYTQLSLHQNQTTIVTLEQQIHCS